MEAGMKYYPSLAEAVEAVCGMPVKVTGMAPVSGGDINLSYIITLSDGSRMFMKENKADRSDMFLKEAEGLEAIRKSGSISVPAVYAYGCDGSNSFLLMEYIQPAKQRDDYYEELGRNLAEMHKAECGSYVGNGRYGFSADNYIGAGAQENTPGESWIGFFRDRRLIPQIKRAEGYFGKTEMKMIDRLLEKLDDILVEPERPSLVHGDLWYGNVITGNDGKAWLIDPAVYVGHAEADIAMTELFGGFPKRFYESYFETNKLAAGYEERRDIYNLYHLMNHLNLFGGGYYYEVMSIISRY